jgi:hypothetical protein
MPMNRELRAFHGVVGLVLLIPLIGGLVGAFGGLEGMARLLRVDPEIVVGVWHARLGHLGRGVPSR